MAGPADRCRLSRVIYVWRMSASAEGAGGRRARMPRLLILTPDYPPARGGIQVLVHRLAAGLEDFETRVVTLDGAGAGSFDANSELSVRRVHANGSAGAARNLALNASAIREAARHRPDLLLSAHIVTSPAAAAIRGMHGARTVQNFYAKE